MPTGTKTTQLLRQAHAAGKPLYRFAQDSQKSKLYRAERVIRTGPQLTQVEAQNLVNKIRTSAYVLRNYGDPGEIWITVSNRRKRKSSAFTSRGEIRLAAAWGLSADVIVHEVAHFYATPAGDPGHDWLFCYIYLDFVRKFLGADEADKLKASFKANKIRHAPPRKRKPMTADQKAAAADRMAKARAARVASSIEPHVIVIPRHDGGYALVAGNTIPNGGWLRTTGQLIDRWTGEVHDKVFVRKTDAGISKALAKVRTWPGEAKDALAVPVSRLQVTPNGWLCREWEPV